MSRLRNDEKQSQNNTQKAHTLISIRRENEPNDSVILRDGNLI